MPAAHVQRRPKRSAGQIPRPLEPKEQARPAPDCYGVFGPNLIFQCQKALLPLEAQASCTKVSGKFDFHSAFMCKVFPPLFDGNLLLL